MADRKGYRNSGDGDLAQPRASVEFRAPQLSLPLRSERQDLARSDVLAKSEIYRSKRGKRSFNREEFLNSETTALAVPSGARSRTGTVPASKFRGFKPLSRRHSDAATSCRKCLPPRPQRVPPATREPPHRSAFGAVQSPGTARPLGRRHRTRSIGEEF